MRSNRFRALAAFGLALGLTLGSGTTALSQFGLGGGHGEKPDESRVTTAGTNTLIAVETPEKDGIKVYNIDEGTWSEYRAPRGTRVRPCGAGGYIATMPEGPKITQLAAYSDQSHRWITLDLPEPAQGKLWGPILAPAMAVYVDGRRVYAFSASASKWGVLELPEGAQPHPITTARVASVLHVDHIYIFNAKFGRWDDSAEKAR